MIKVKKSFMRRLIKMDKTSKYNDYFISPDKKYCR